MASVDPATGQPLPPEAIQRVLYLTPRVHIYQIPPLTSNRGYTAATWTNNPPIFTARLRIIETSIPAGSTEKVSTNILLEDGSSGELFAAAPYSHPSIVTQTVDSSRFFALRVVGDGGRKATLGIGFEERSEAFDFGVTLQDCNKTLDHDTAGGQQDKNVAATEKHGLDTERPPDYSLKEGQTITINIGNRGAKSGSHKSAQVSAGQSLNDMSFLPPPPSAAEVKSERHQDTLPPAASIASKPGLSAKELGFDDGEFGEFQ